MNVGAVGGGCGWGVDAPGDSLIGWGCGFDALAASAQTVYVTGTYSSICGCVQKVISDDAEGGLSSGLWATVSSSSHVVNSKRETRPKAARPTRIIRMRAAGVETVRGGGRSITPPRGPCAPRGEDRCRVDN